MHHATDRHRAQKLEFQRYSPATIGNIPEYGQITVADTGWSEAAKEHMRQAGYDDMDMIRAWYS